MIWKAQAIIEGIGYIFVTAMVLTDEFACFVFKHI